MTKTDQPHYKYYKDQQLSIIKAPFCGGQAKLGVEKGPRYLLKAGLESDLNGLGWNTIIESPLDESEIRQQMVADDPTDKYLNAKRPRFVGESNEKIYNCIKEKVLAFDRFPLTIGGDHSIGMATVSATLEKFPNAGLLWVDAHTDIHTIETTDTGNIHGCPVSFLLGLNKNLNGVPKSFDWVPGNLRPEKIAYIGLRSVDPAERKILRDLGISAFSMYHIDKFGINKVIEMALESIHPDTNGDGPIICSFDVDAIDPLFVPATGVPVKGGLTLREGLFVAERLAETGNLVSLDVVECNPELVTDGKHLFDSVEAGCAIARCALGETLL
ncbi:hypothetical protein KAFR_0E00640 [Kazachstania africana CBS 2517]|uniref:Arginase n=1 Tax=Kazachstania africana (strain ATCC 22294 / BCRC 22015 / CBS 2517 / CECT 1963 / NBRC 1671 / NRRL Y-8276) TaxID=1071382 RepID=H2AV18_KAZAF|nr:hypothetical protein KAFR_0E00640 [Kazachstania africana CBS 2517]CCF58218.1 hypothetical protein KAFR_0E00640 [Kazachstania africana CBS 2517]